ncbi:MAG: hypothetical protein C0418_04460 [Coriobacteriaceae bacterium]|nr:hypothetical protein [Coriobacteriaceae bacterium]
MMNGYGIGGFGGLGLLGPLGGMATMGLGLLLVVGLVVWLVYSLTRETNTGPAVTAAPGTYAPTQTSAPAPHDPAREIVRERYARGEIDEVEYNRLIAGLS